MSKSGLILIIILLLLAATSSWWNWSSTNQALPVPGNPDIVSDYFLESFTIRDLNLDSSTDFIFSGDRLDYYVSNNSSNIKNPRFVINGKLIDNKQSPWTITAESAEASREDMEQIHFHKNVKMHRPAQQQKSAMTIETEELLILAKEEIAESNSPTLIILEGTQLAASSMRIDFKNGLYNFNNVKSRIITQ